MQFFKFGWFSSKEREELQKKMRQVEDENLMLRTTKQVLTSLGEEIDKVVEENKKPYKSLRLIGDTTLVVLVDGITLSGAGELFDMVKVAQSEAEIIDLFTVKEEVKGENKLEIETKEEKQLIKDNLDVLRDHSDFVIKGDEVYLKGVSLALPVIIVSSFIEILEKKGIDVYPNAIYDFKTPDLDEQYQALKAFTYKLFLCPIEEGRNSLLKFIKENNIKITSTGNFIGFRRIDIVGDNNTDLIEFVSTQYFKIKKWKKSPKNYFVVEDIEIIEEKILEEGHYEDDPDYSPIDEDDEDYYEGANEEEGSIWIEERETIKKVEKSILKLTEQIVTEYKQIGNLEELYLKLPELQENRYTDNRTSSYDIRIGSTYKIREEDLNLNRYGSCGGALHIADGKNYDYSGFGNTPIVAIVNPMHVVKTDTGCIGKIGVKQMFIATITTFNENGNYVDIDDQDLVVFDEIYHNETIAELEEAIRNKSFEVLTTKEEISPVSIIDLKIITEALKNRVITI